MHALLQEVVDGQRSWEHGHEAEDWLGIIGQHVNRATGSAALLADYRDGVEPESEPRARWITRVLFDNGDDFDLVSAPMQPGALLEDALWSQAYAVVCTSATLTALGSFERFIERAGLERRRRYAADCEPVRLSAHRNVQRAGDVGRPARRRGAHR